jgi:peptidoglycan-N-acetylglucosamine deacetylase
LFFCTGEAAERQPDLIVKIISNGHLIGNHGHLHLHGWRTPAWEYIADIERAAPHTSDCLFRPPYGSITPMQYFKLKRKYKIIFWDIMPYDFDEGFGSKKSLSILNRLIRSGSVIVLHDGHGSNVLSFIEDFIVSAEDRGYVWGDPMDLKS